MAIYKYDRHFIRSRDAIYDTDQLPGAPAPFAGIYRCQACGREVTAHRAEPLPPPSHHPHPVTLGVIRWRLVICADPRGA